MCNKLRLDGHAMAYGLFLSMLSWFFLPAPFKSTVNFSVFHNRTNKYLLDLYATASFSNATVPFTYIRLSDGDFSFMSIESTVYNAFTQLDDG